jgi:hypothetical protein
MLATGTASITIATTTITMTGTITMTDTIILACASGLPLVFLPGSSTPITPMGTPGMCTGRSVLW